MAFDTWPAAMCGCEWPPRQIQFDGKIRIAPRAPLPICCLWKKVERAWQSQITRFRFFGSPLGADASPPWPLGTRISTAHSSLPCARRESIAGRHVRRGVRAQSNCCSLPCPKSRSEPDFAPACVAIPSRCSATFLLNWSGAYAAQSKRMGIIMLTCAILPQPLG